MTVPSKPNSWMIAALDELRPVCERIDPAELDALSDALAAARRVVTYGVGREGLMMGALCMRLMHAGLDAHVAGDMSTPPVQDGDLLVVSAGPGEFSTVLALMTVARSARARLAVLTAVVGGPAEELADVVLHVPARTMADDLEAPGVLPMGSAFEAIELLLTDLLALRAAASRGDTGDRMRARHTNLE